MFNILQLNYIALLIRNTFASQVPDSFFSARENDLELMALKILSKNLRWIFWLICLPKIQPSQTRELS